MRLLLYCLLGIAIVTPSVLLVLWAKYFPDTFKGFWKKAWGKTSRSREIANTVWQYIWEKVVTFSSQIQVDPAKRKILASWVGAVGVIIFGLFQLKSLFTLNLRTAPNTSIWIWVGAVLFLLAFSALLSGIHIAKRLGEIRLGGKEEEKKEKGKESGEKNWYKRPLTYIALAGLIVAIIAGRSFIPDPSKLTPTQIGTVIGIAVIVGLCFAFKRMGGAGAISSAAHSSGKLLKGLVVSGIFLAFVTGLLMLVKIKTGRNVWFDIQETRLWGGGLLVLGALTLAYAKGLLKKAGGFAVAWLGLILVVSEISVRVAAEEAVIAQARAQVYAQKAANTPASEKFWTLKRQNCTPDGILLATFTRYNMLVKRLDDEVVEMTQYYQENGAPQVCHFLWKKRESPDGRWQQHKPPAGGTFRIWPDPDGGVDRYIGVEVLSSGLRLRLELEGKLQP